MARVSVKFNRFPYFSTGELFYACSQSWPCQKLHRHGSRYFFSFSPWSFEREMCNSEDRFLVNLSGECNHIFPTLIYSTETQDIQIRLTMWKFFSFPLSEYWSRWRAGLPKRPVYLKKILFFIFYCSVHFYFISQANNFQFSSVE